MVRVLIADDDELFLKALSLLLDAESGFEIVGVAHDGDEAVRLTLELEPDAVLLDVQMGALSGLDAAKQIREALPSTLIMVHSGAPTVDAYRESHRLGFNIRNKYELAGTISALLVKP
jgi:YesN/AraC family two-component response regulator